MPTTEKPAAFCAFNPHEEVRTYYRNLPHWRQKNATYFVTFRLADSIPQRVLLGWQEEDRIWLRSYGIDGPLSESNWQKAYKALPAERRQSFERRAARRMHIELDKNHGSCLLRVPDARKTAVDSIRYFHKQRCYVGDFVVMPNHIHGLFQPMRAYELEDILGSIKGYISTAFTKKGFKNGRLWQQENYDRLVRDRSELDVWRNYIQRNPEKARLGINQYTYSRCEWLDNP